MAMEIYYDGECPLCSAYMRMLRLRASVREVALIDLRSDDPRAVHMRREGPDPDQGMIVRYNGELFHGDRAMGLLAVLSDSGAMARVSRALFADPARAARVYPWLSSGRALLLRLLGRERIRS